jgi:hypothetical protein
MDATPITADANGLEVQGAGTAGTAAGGVVTIQGVASMTAVQVADNGGSLTVDGTVGVSGTVTVDGSGVTQPVSHAALTELAAAIDTEVQCDIVGALPSGTNAIGKLAANSGVDIGDVTLTAGTDAIGKLLPPDVDVTTHTNYKKIYYTNTGAVTDGIVWSPAAGKRWHVVSIKMSISAAATVTFEDDLAAGDSVVDKGEYAANSGFAQYYGEKYPLASGEDAADLLVTTSAGNIYITITGYEI